MLSQKQEDSTDHHKVAAPSAVVLKLQEQIMKYATQWSQRDDALNFEQKHEIDLAKIFVKPSVEDQIKVQVDELIGEELDMIRQRYDIKKKKPKRPKKAKNSSKNGKKKFPGDSQNKHKDPKDILAGLVEKRVAKKLLPAILQDFIGEQSTLNRLHGVDSSTIKQAEDHPSIDGKKKKIEQAEQPEINMPDPSFAQIRQVIAETIAMPLGSKVVKQKLDKQNYFCFFGAHGSGKSLALRVLAHECNALLIDISPSNIDGSLNDKKQIEGMINSAFRVAKEYQPAIIYCEDFELVLSHAAGKKKKGQQPIVAVSNQIASKMKKPLLEFKKGKFFDPDDRVVFIGITNKPWESNAKEIKHFFDKKIYFPFPNYGTRIGLFKAFLENFNVTIAQGFPLSTLAHITEGWSSGSIKMAIQKVLTERRLQRIIEEPLKLSEFISPLASTPFTSKEDYREFKKFNQIVSGYQNSTDSKKAVGEGKKENRK